MGDVLLDRVRETTATWDRNQRAAYLSHLVQRLPTTGALAAFLDPENNRQVPWLRVLDRELEWAYATPDARLMVSVPSQEGKSTRAVVWGAVRALMLNPRRRIIIATHSEDLARSHSERIRTILQTFGTGAQDSQTGTPLPDLLGIGLGSKASSTRWTLSGHQGGVVAVGVGTALPGRPADMMILDDLSAGMQEADSPAGQRRLRLWWDSVASQRLAPGAPVICIGTRWSLNDIFSYLLEQEPDRWRRLNFPAIAQAGVLDSLGREPGVPLDSARGYRDWAYQRQIKPARVWASTYMGHPVPTEGGIFSPGWFEQRITGDCPPLYRKIIAIDPADSGVGDLTGIIAMGLTADGTVILTDDASGLMTSDQWAKTAVDLAKRTGATEIVYEAFAAKETYGRILRDTARTAGMPKLRVTPWKQSGSAAARATGLSNAIETGKARVLGHKLAEFETDATTWLGEGTHCPDRVAAAVAGFDHLAPRTGGRVTLPSASRFERRIL